MGRHSRSSSSSSSDSEDSEEREEREQRERERREEREYQRQQREADKKRRRIQHKAQEKADALEWIFSIPAPESVDEEEPFTIGMRAKKPLNAPPTVVDTQDWLAQTYVLFGGWGDFFHLFLSYFAWNLGTFLKISSTGARCPVPGEARVVS